MANYRPTYVCTARPSLATILSMDLFRNPSLQKNAQPPDLFPKTYLTILQLLSSPTGSYQIDSTACFG